MDISSSNTAIGTNASLKVLLSLTGAISAGADSVRLVAVLAELTGCGTVLEDADFTQTEAFLDVLPDSARLKPLVSLKTSLSFKSMTESRRLPKAPAPLTDDDGGLTVRRLVAPVAAGGERLGWLSLLRAEKPFDEVEKAVLGDAAAMFAVHLAQQKKLRVIELRLKGNFAEDLVSQRDMDPDSIRSRALALGFNLSLPHRVLVGEIENLGQVMSHLGSAADAAVKFWEALVGAVQSRLGPDGMATRKNDELLLLVRQENATSPIGPAKALAEDMIDMVSALFKAKLFIGIGNVCTELGDYRESYMQAKKALEIGTYMITEGQVRSFEQFKVHALFLSTLKPAELYDYARSQLGALLDYDEKHKTEFLKTLQEFLYLRNNVEATARSLSMSVSGLKYRLTKIEQVVGVGLKDYKVCFDLQLALIILQIFGEYKIRNFL